MKIHAVTATVENTTAAKATERSEGDLFVMFCRYSQSHIIFSFIEWVSIYARRNWYGREGGTVEINQAEKPHCPTENENLPLPLFQFISINCDNPENWGMS